jgi:hypothetical protein
MAGNPTCKEPEHKMHMCAMKESGLGKKNPDKFREMTANPKYRCDNCDAKAAKSENLCKPVKL